METGLKPFLTLREVAEYVGRPYQAVWGWATAGRIQTEKLKREGGNTSYRVPREAAEEVKKRLDDGLWV